MNNYKELKVWQRSMQVVKEIYALINLLPIEERYALADQMKRAAVSIPSNIAEGYGRNYRSDYARFLNMARGSKCELETQIEICIMLNYFSREQTKSIFLLLDETGKMLNALIKTLNEPPNP